MCSDLTHSYWRPRALALARTWAMFAAVIGSYDSLMKCSSLASATWQEKPIEQVTGSPWL